MDYLCKQVHKLNSIISIYYTKDSLFKSKYKPVNNHDNYISKISENVEMNEFHDFNINAKCYQPTLYFPNNELESEDDKFNENDKNDNDKKL